MNVVAYECAPAEADNKGATPCRVLSHTALLAQRSPPLCSVSFSTFAFFCGFFAVSAASLSASLSLSAFLSLISLCLPRFPASVLHQSKPSLSGEHRLKAHILSPAKPLPVYEGEGEKEKAFFLGGV